MQKGGYALKPQEAKDRFIILRAEGKSYDAIAQELHIAKGTCSAWEQELSQAIAKLKTENLQSLYDAYHMTKEARIKGLGKALEKIDTAIEAADFTGMQPKDLLKSKLEYTAALKEEYVAPAAVPIPEDLQPASLMESLKDLLRRVRAGEVTTEQAHRESMVLSNILKAYEQAELKAKLDTLQAALDARD